MATTASEYLAEMIEGDDGDEFLAQVYDIAGTDWVFPGTQLPTWLREAAFESLDQTFSFDYWTDVPQVTRDAVLATLRDGIRDGLSIRELAEKIKEDRGSGYAEYRATATARTETTSAMNSGHSAGIDALAEDIGVDVRKEWLSVMGSTTRPEHAAMDGQQSDEEGMFTLTDENGTEWRIPWPGHPDLSASMRINCQCTLISSFAGEELQ